MFKKIFAIVALTAVLALLVWGGIIRTQAKAGGETSGQAAHGAETASQGAAAHGQGVTSSGEQARGSGATSQGNAHSYQGEQAGQSGSGKAAESGTGGPEAHAYAGEAAALPPADPNGLTAEETAALLYMLEEEKLAGDVYTYFYNLWNLPVFKNIASSEQTHMAAVQGLLDRYGIQGTASPQPGVFTNPDLQALYTKLVAQGTASLVEALKVGGAIEEIDILDLQARLAQTDQQDIQQVFTSLASGSENHLRSFSAQYTAKSIPQFLSVDAYQAIVSSTTGTGGGQGHGKGNGGGGGNSSRP